MPESAAASDAAAALVSMSTFSSPLTPIPKRSRNLVLDSARKAPEEPEIGAQTRV